MASGLRIDRIDVDAMERIRQTDIWQDYEARIRKRLDSAERSCCNSGLEAKAIRFAQGEFAALQFVLGLPDLIQKEVVRTSDGKRPG